MSHWFLFFCAHGVLNDLISKGKRKKIVCRDQWQWYVRCMQYTWEVHGRFLTGVKTNTVFLYGNQPDWHDRCAANGARNKHVNEAKFFFTKGSWSQGRDRLARGPGDKSNPIKGSLIRKLFWGRSTCKKVFLKKVTLTSCGNKIKRTHTS